MPLLFILLVTGLFAASSLTSFLPNSQSSFPFPSPSPFLKSKPSGNYCLTEEQFQEILGRPVALVCNRTNIDRTEILEENVPYVLAEENVVVKKTFIHSQKQLILKEICAGSNYYTWKCHPPSWGSIYSNTLWKLREGDPNRPIQDGDTFDVYLRKDINPIPQSWICKNTGNQAIGNTTTSNILAEDNPLEGKMIHVVTYSAIWERRDDAQKIDIEDVPSRQKIAEFSIEGKDYDVFVNLLKALSPDSTVYLYLVEKGVLPESNDGLPDQIFYDAFRILHNTDPKGKTLKLATFNPFPPQEHGWWDVYLPESKPVVYLYPQKPTLLNFKINPKDGFVTVSDPPYDPETGWTVLARPDGTLTLFNHPDSPNLPDYPYLYYETMVKGYQIPKEGWAIKKENLASFFNEILPQVGLNEKESQDFTEYWIPRLENEVSTDYIFITFIPQSQIETVDSFEITQPFNQTIQPSISIRVRAYFKPLKEWQEVTPQIFPFLPKRQGFTVIEWGGILDSV